MMRILFALSAFLPAVGTAVAQEPPALPCGNLPGCAGGAENVLAETVLPNAAAFLVRITAGAAVLFIIMAGYQFMLARGDDAKITAGRWAVLNALMGLALAIVSQVIVSGVVTEGSIIGAQNEIDLLSAVRNILLLALNATFLIVVVYGGILMLNARGKPDEFRKGTATVTWAIIGAAIINLANAFVQMLASFFGV